MKRILVAEDEDVIRDFVVINLKRSGYEVVDMPTGDDALRVYDETGGDFDVVLLDIMMPGTDGISISIAPYKVAVLPLQKNMSEKAHEVLRKLNKMEM